jgi:hypothetical protein
MSDFYTIETPPPSSSTSKDSIDESISLLQTRKRIKLIGPMSNQLNSKTDEVRKFLLKLKCRHNNNLIAKMMTYIRIYFLLLI